MSSSDDGAVLLADLELSRGLTVQMTAVGTLGFVVAFAAFTALYQFGTGGAVSYDFAPAGVAWWNPALNFLVIAVLATVVILPHELVHGLAIRYYGGEARYGVGLAHFIMPYAYATTDHRMHRDQFLVVLLAPLVLLSLLGIPLMVALDWGWLIVPLAANAAGAVADVWMSLTMLGYPSHVLIEDHDQGVRILGREGDRAPELSIAAVAWDALAGASVASVGLFVLLGVGGPFVLSAIGVDAITVGRPGTITYLFSFVSRPDEISLGVGPAVLVLGALSGLLYAFARTVLRRRERPRPSAELPA